MNTIRKSTAADKRAFDAAIADLDARTKALAATYEAEKAEYERRTKAYWEAWEALQAERAAQIDPKDRDWLATHPAEVALLRGDNGRALSTKLGLWHEGHYTAQSCWTERGKRLRRALSIIDQEEATPGHQMAHPPDRT